jgi:hypothetical protein
MREIENSDPSVTSNRRGGSLVRITGGHSCVAMSPQAWRCSLTLDHTGRHVALCDSPLQVMSTWGGES